MNVRVTFERKLVTERSSTNVAFVGFNTEMNFFVVLQMRSLWKGRVTPLAFVWFFTAKVLNLFLVLNIFFFLDSWNLPSVYSPMVPQRRMSCKTFIADLTNVRLFTFFEKTKQFYQFWTILNFSNSIFLPGVCSFVILEMWRLTEGHAAGIATIRFLIIGENLLVKLQTLHSSTFTDYILVHLFKDATSIQNFDLFIPPFINSTT